MTPGRKSGEAALPGSGTMMEEVAVTAMSAGAMPAGADAAVPPGPPESASALPPPENSGAALFAARPALIRAMNEQLLLEHIRQRGPCSRAELARVSGLSKPTVSLALDNVERAGLVRIAGQRTGVPGRSARLYEIRPDAGQVLGLDIGHDYVRGAIADLSGEIRARESLRAHATSVRGRVAELVGLASLLCENAGVSRSAITQTVIGSPGVYDPRRNAMKLTGGLRGWDRPAALAGLREAFGPSLVMENDVDAAALAERALGHGREIDHFALVHIGTGIGMGLVLGGQLLRGAHGVAGEIAFLPLSGGAGADEHEARKRGTLEAAASASGIVRAARRGGMRGPVSARRVFEAASGGDERAMAVVAEEAQLIAKTICAVIAVVDPDLIVLGGGIGRAPGFAEVVSRELEQIAPVMPAIRVSALGTDAVVDGCLSGRHRARLGPGDDRAVHRCRRTASASHSENRLTPVRRFAVPSPREGQARRDHRTRPGSRPSGRMGHSLRDPA